MTILDTELHVHLYGCLTAEDVWELGKDRYERQAARLDWYAAEYAAAYGRRPDPAAYWTSPDGLDRLKADFLFTDPAPFACFQARFNLLIALLPITPDDTTVLRHVLAAQRAAGLRYGEYRSFIPLAFDPAAASRHVAVMADAVLAFNAESGSAFQASLAFSLQRQPDTALAQFQLLQAVLAAVPERQGAVTGVDFCGVEEGHPPASMRSAFAAMHRANQKNPEGALAILYHVGESFTDKTLASAVRWVWEAHAYGAHRLGHALALGLAPELEPATRSETVAERRAHLEWLQTHAGWLAECGYLTPTRAAPMFAAELAQLKALPAAEQSTGTLTLASTPELQADCRSLQNAVMRDLARRGAIIESCPTSNIRIGGLGAAADHPLPRFLAAGLKTVVASDDPGIFAISLATEEEFCRRELGLSSPALAALAATSHASRAKALAVQARHLLN